MSAKVEGYFDTIIFAISSQAALFGFGQCSCMALTTVLFQALLSSGLALCSLNVAFKSEAGILFHGISNWLIHLFCGVVDGNLEEWDWLRGGVGVGVSCVSKDGKSTIGSSGMVHRMMG